VIKHLRPDDGPRAVILANGVAPPAHLYNDLLAEANLVVAADGGANALLEAGLRLDVVVGDLDSIDPTALTRWRQSGGVVVAAARRKDETDLELGLDYCLGRKASRIAIVAALGGRTDHMLANIFLLASLDRTVSCVIVAPDCRVQAVRGGETLHFDARIGDLLSLLPFNAPVEGITTSGLEYPLHDEPLVLGAPRGVSNVFTATEASVSVGRGVLFAIQTWSDARPLSW